jgi:hypothetical protein
MSDAELHPALSPRQFGPGGKYTTRPVDMFGERRGPDVVREVVVT